MRSILLTVLLGTIALRADADGTATYLGNEGVLISRGDIRILFDPLFDNGFDQFQMVPYDMQTRLFAGEPPFDGVDAIFVSHAHGDHFSAELMARYLSAHPDVRLYAPVQAATLLNEAAADAAIRSRVTGLALEPGDEPFSIDIDGIRISAIRIPHSGWPDRMTDIENLSFHVVLGDDVSVAHFGDSDADRSHFEPYAAYWAARDTDLAMPPYWFFLSPSGRDIVESIVRPAASVGTHVPVELPAYPAAETAEFKAYDLFRLPGEERSIP